MSGLEVTSVSHGYAVRGHRLEVLHDVSLHVAPGEMVALAGPSGSGKSTLCHLVAGFETPDAGSVTLDGRPCPAVADWARLAAVPQQHGLLAGLSVTDNIALPAHRARLDPAALSARLEELAEALDLTAFTDRAVTETSLGEQQRTAIARALVLAPTLVVLDEPTGHQDDDHVAQVIEVLAESARAGSAVVVASHDERVWSVADRVVRLEDGRVLA